MSAGAADRRARLTFRGGGWVLVLVAVVCLGLVAWAVLPALQRTTGRPPGDGRTLESYGFDLGALAVPRDLVAPALLHRDMVPARTDPPVAAGPEIQAYDDEHRGKLIVPDDEVIGVAIGGEARAYPISQMTVHEIVNDTLGGVPIAVTYHFLGDAACVLDRRLDGRTLRFGTSGLLYNCNLVMYDVPSGLEPSAPAPTASLWSQLRREAIAGPEVGRRLDLVRAAVVRWADWLALHPDTSIMLPDPALAKRYKKSGRADYFRSDVIPYPVARDVPADGPAPKTAVLAVAVDGARRVYPIPEVARRAGRAMTWTDELGGTTLRFDYAVPEHAAGATLRVTDDATGEPVHAIRAFWFVWHAMHPDDELMAGAAPE